MIKDPEGRHKNLFPRGVDIIAVFLGSELIYNYPPSFVFLKFLGLWNNENVSSLCLKVKSALLYDSFNHSMFIQ